MAIRRPIDLCPNRKLAGTCSLAAGSLLAVYIGWSLFSILLLPAAYLRQPKAQKQDRTHSNGYLNVTEAMDTIKKFPGGMDTIKKLPDSMDTIKKLPDGRLYSVIPTEDYLPQDDPAFTPLPEIVNTLDYRFLIPGENICNSGNSTFLLMLILSTVDAFNFRNAIRSTWLNGAIKDNWPTGSVYHSVKYIFLIGNDEGARRRRGYTRLEKESRVFQDIVVADFRDSYRNLTTKVLIGFKWALQYCRDAKFILKVDSDTMINVPLMTQLIDQVVDDKRDIPFVLGLQHHQDKPVVVRRGKWAVSRDEYEPDSFPSYLYGHTYVVRDTAMSSLLDRARHMTLLAPEDAFITGILAKSLGIARLTAPSFTVTSPHRSDCEFVKPENVAFTDVKDILVMLKLWNNFKEHQCTPKTSFLKWL